MNSIIKQRSFTNFYGRVSNAFNFAETKKLLGQTFVRRKIAGLKILICWCSGVIHRNMKKRIKERMSIRKWIVDKWIE